MKEYLEENQLSFNAYIKNLYSGNIWADEYIIGGLAKMFNIKISIVTPYCSDIWNVFHNSTMPDVVLVANGCDFKGKHNITHFTMTKGKAASWKCVGSELNIGEVGNRRGFSNEKSMAITVYEATEKQNILRKSENIAKGLDSLCHDLKNLCIRRDRLFQELNEMQLPIKQFKRFNRYFITESIDSSTKQKTPSSKEVTVSTQKKQSKKSKPEKSKATEQLNPKPFPKVLGQKLVSDVVKEMDKGMDKLECEDQLMLHKLNEPARIHFQEKISSTELAGAASTFPLLPSIAECTTLLKEAQELEKTLKLTERQQNMVKESEEPIVPLDLKKDITDFMEQGTEKEKSTVPFEWTKEQEQTQQSESTEEKTVITSQPTRSNIDIFSNEIAHEAHVPHFQDVLNDAPENFEVMYKKMRMSKGIADFLTDRFPK